VLAFSPMLRAVPVRCDVTSQPRWSVIQRGYPIFSFAAASSPTIGRR